MLPSTTFPSSGEGERLFFFFFGGGERELESKTEKQKEEI